MNDHNVSHMNVEELREQVYELSELKVLYREKAYQCSKKIDRQFSLRREWYQKLNAVQERQAYLVDALHRMGER